MTTDSSSEEQKEPDTHTKSAVETDFKARFTAQFADEDADMAADTCYQYMQLSV